MKNSQLYTILLVITCSPHMSMPFAMGSTAVYLVLMLAEMWRERN
jgi:hypothetical protein